MKPAADVAAEKAAQLLDDAEKNFLDTVYVQASVTVADAWIRLHLVLATGAAVNWDELFPGRGA